jgi:hypothetical protein
MGFSGMGSSIERRLLRWQPSEESRERKGIFRFASPKEVARSDLVHALKRLTEEKQWAVRLVLVTGFAPDALATETGAERGRVMTPENYMKEMANSKICLAPRGTSLETFRHYCFVSLKSERSKTA